MIDLMERHDDGKVIKLWWDENDDTTTITVRDLHSESSFTVEVPKDKALDAYWHPYAYEKVLV